MSLLYKEVMKLLKKYPDVLYGVTDLTYCEYRKTYKRALVLAVPHANMMSLTGYDEEKFEELICDARRVIDDILDEMEEILTRSRITYYIPPVGQNTEATLAAPFSFKYAATKAGIGWVGKNDLLITSKYGPRVRLAAVLVDDEWPVSEMVTESRCPKDCHLCVDACPCKAITGREWGEGVNRIELIDYKRCNQERSHYIKIHGRKNACGLCMVNCPIGLKQDAQELVLMGQKEEE
ncbi:MAG: epoxyqueuosine reductase [Lachnospiraceae bacterium]|nr:epoxyqueuosine reductase [Lachnospiraceae bacterium]